MEKVLYSVRGMCQFTLYMGPYLRAWKINPQSPTGGSFVPPLYIFSHSLSIIDRSPTSVVAVFQLVMLIITFTKLPVTVQVHYDN